MRVLFVTSEAYPLIKTGGLADVSGALPPALNALGVETRILLPGYPAALEGVEDARVLADLSHPFPIGQVRLVEGRMPDSGCLVLLIDCPALYHRDGGPYQAPDGSDWADNHLRFGLLGWVAARLSQENSPIGWRADILHCHDWQAGLAPAYLEYWGETHTASVTTIHNMAYAGIFPAERVPQLDLPWSLYTPEGFEFWQNLSFLKAGLVFSDKLTTVSPTYAREIQSAPHGCGFEGLLSHRSADLVGILNGADYSVWTPETDPHLLHPFAPGDRRGKAANKAALQRELGLPETPDAPLFVIISRLNWHKGMDLVLEALPRLVAGGAQLAVLGTGERGLEEGFRDAALRHPEQVAARIGYSEALAHRMQAGGDLLLMPSRSEPCGLTQIYAFRYGTLPLVNRTGGLADTVTDAAFDSLSDGSATGFVCDEATMPALEWTLERALALYRQPDQWSRMVDAAFAQDFGWNHSAQRYFELYQSLRP
ncbi:glycogen synthase GlgA [Telmatospirillum sp. J64-1]|uniref:glycogen synthase GlgA n=1 Tax=Telmatospirillum sp. J64-1 TaxID=2502183 RepID=UPI00115D46FF|nr:glycogen synthase GlgA [Telmatospirillum sp. J64-1]